MDIQYVHVFVATLLQFILGALWYSPVLFGKQWMKIMEVTHLSKNELQKIQKEMAPFYALQFFLTVVTTVAFSFFLRMSEMFTSLSSSQDLRFPFPYTIALWIWIGFITPTQIASIIWGNTKKRFWLKQSSIMVSYQLIAIMISTFVLTWK